jgi:hypothetical protein
VSSSRRLLHLLKGLAVILRAVSQSSDKLRAPRLPVSLASMQVDITNRLGELTASTPTGLTSLDAWMLGGFRNGTMFVVSGAPGIGKTAFLLLLAYMAARARAAVVFVSAALDETEVLARLAARALYREYPESETPYGTIWSGDAWQDEVTRGPVGTSVNVAIRKVGQLFHLYRAKPFDTTLEIGAAAAHLWGRNDRVILFIDGVEALGASVAGDTTRAATINSNFANRMTQVGYELHHLAEGGCAVVVTAERDHAGWLLPGATMAAELVPAARELERLSPRDRVLGAQGIDLVVTKNHVGPTGTIPLKFIAGGAVFEEVDIQGAR